MSFPNFPKHFLDEFEEKITFGAIHKLLSERHLTKNENSTEYLIKMSETINKDSVPRISLPFSSINWDIK